MSETDKDDPKEPEISTLEIQDSVIGMDEIRDTNKNTQGGE